MSRTKIDKEELEEFFILSDLTIHQAKEASASVTKTCVSKMRALLASSANCRREQSASGFVRSVRERGEQQMIQALEHSTLQRSIVAIERESSIRALDRLGRWTLRRLADQSRHEIHFFSLVTALRARSMDEAVGPAIDQPV